MHIHISYVIFIPIRGGESLQSLLVSRVDASSPLHHHLTMKGQQKMNFQDLFDMESIRQSLASYARGMDRQDLNLVMDAYWPEGWDAHGMHEGTAAQFGAFASKSWPLLRMHHLLGQSLIELDGAFANVETYFIAHQHVIDGGGEYVAAGRYLDRFERRGDVWKVLHRVVVFDWRREWTQSQADAEKLSALPECNRGTTQTDYSWDLFSSKPLRMPVG